MTAPRPLGHDRRGIGADLPHPPLTVEQKAAVVARIRRSETPEVADRLLDILGLKEEQ